MEAKKEFMMKSIEAAKEAARDGDYAIGAVVVKDDRIVSVGRDTFISTRDPVNGHAEIDVIRKACKKLGQPYLEGCALYSTHEPCPMCISAAVWAKMDTVVFGVTQQDMIEERDSINNSGFSWRQITIPCSEVLEKSTPRIHLVSGFMRKECAELFTLNR